MGVMTAAAMEEDVEMMLGKKELSNKIIIPLNAPPLVIVIHCHLLLFTL